MAFAVKRTTGKFNHDYLHAWDETWGTACMLSPAKAMTFATLEAAEQAAEKAQRLCKGRDGQPAEHVKFEACALPSAQAQDIQ